MFSGKKKGFDFIPTDAQSLIFYLHKSDLPGFPRQESQIKQAVYSLFVLGGLFLVLFDFLFFC
jgi:hypothetical protein